MTAVSHPQRGAAARVALGVLRAVGGVLIVVWGAATAGFIAIKAIPGDPVDVMLGVQAQVSESVRDQIRADWGLNDPPFDQYLQYLGRLVSGNLGESYQLRQPVVEVLYSGLGPTLALAGAAILLAVLAAFVGALIVRGRAAKAVASIAELIVVSSPTFWIGLVLIAVFAFQLGWFPVTATQGLPGLVLPAVTLALPLAGIISQVLRQGTDAALAQPFALTARSRGIGHTRLVLRHTLRHAAADTITLTGYLLGSVLGGVVLVETVFGRNGLGRVTLRAITDRDLPVVLGIIVFTAAVFAIINALVDLSYRAIDPRLSGRGTAS
ncbi:peptide/nickel transport system permease protein [Microbacteriaceae bacterium SG_E_30_P1]|uniref:Peptide/nickel transport system permease protein n=1 Tax=Antiquaquibacter oligotrophicus TaxID=2880260 RepID=A0ABT6KMJ2_9MICO|nr:ABC transporter permease [Antiquaquibacter oligotrophicus]MDH6181233.1 peptide/nickel transport system permease protein [Antiquaquibacter oligotrophicus]UDF13072.1 ABC transporter permease [Antiquaquibacter oligotrophicus]